MTTKSSLSIATKLSNSLNGIKAHDKSELDNASLVSKWVEEYVIPFGSRCSNAFIVDRLPMMLDFKTASEELSKLGIEIARSTPIERISRRLSNMLSRSQGNTRFVIKLPSSQTYVE